MNGILFVDDDVRIVEALQARLRRQRHRWDMPFAVGGLEALAMLGRRSYDVVVTDLRMPRVDGIAVLEHLRAGHPGTVRLVLSGDETRETALKLVPRAHRALAKPCREGELEAALESALAFRQLVADPAVREVVGRISALPPMPRVYARLLGLLEDPDATFSDVGDVIASDISLSAKVLQLANSPMFATRASTSSVRSAIVQLGMDTVRVVVLAEGAFGRRELPGIMRVFASELHRHSLLVARVGMELTRDPALRREAFAAGMLHDIGRLVMELELPGDADEETGTLRMPSAHAPGGATNHANVGAYLLGLWGVPGAIIEAVATHHEDRKDVSLLARILRDAELIVERVSLGRTPTEDQVQAMLQVARGRMPA